MTSDQEAEKYLQALERSVAEGKRFTSAEPQKAGAPARPDAKTQQRPAVSGGRTPSVAPLGPTSTSRQRIDLSGDFAEGDIMLLDDGSVGIFKESVPNKEYQLVYFLEANGHIKPQGVVLAAYQVRKLGAVPAEFLVIFKRSQRWNRDAIVFHIESWDDIACLPPAILYDAKQSPTVGGVDPQRGSAGGAPTSGMTAEAGEGHPSHSGHGAPSFTRSKSQATHGEGGLTVGSRFSIKFGPNDWHAVYWGRDELGDLVVHNTNKEWSMMHLSLSRFQDSLEIGEQLSVSELQEIRRQIEGQS